MKRLIWALPLLAIVVGALSSFLSYRSTTQLLTALGAVDSPSLNQTQALIFDLNTVSDGLKGAVAAADKAAMEAATQKAGRFRDNLKRLADVPGQAEAAAQIGAAFEAWLQSATRVAGIVMDGRNGDALEAAQAMQAAFAALEAGLEARKLAAQQALDTHIEDSQIMSRRGLLASIAASLLTLLLSLGVAGWAMRDLMRQLGGRPEEATRIVRRIASGDLSEPVQLQNPGRSSLLSAMRGMQHQLAGVISDVRGAVDRVQDAAGDIDHGNQTLAERSLRQAERLKASAARIDELTDAVRENSQSADQARELAARARQDADEGSRAVADAVSTMGEISERAHKIVEITALIDGIAFQTNILALNAAVEAARAGEQGRGFNVVAGEVRTLAQRAGVAARDIKALIDDSADRIETGARHVNNAGEVMSHLVESVRQVGECIARISIASAGQRAGIEQVNETVSELGSSTQQNHALVEQAGQASQALLAVARQLGDTVGRFSLEPAVETPKQVA